MNKSNETSGLDTAIVQSLAVGVALADATSWRVKYANRTFTEWFPAAADEDTLSGRLIDLKEDRARQRIDKGRHFSYESEIKAGARTTALRTTLREIDKKGERLILAETVNVTKQKEQEYMLDSFAKLADHNRRQLEKANRALSEKTTELKKAHDLIKAQKDRMERELELARRVQMDMLPMNFVPNHSECTVAGTLKPALEVGGDFFDIFYVDSHRLCFSVGDVSDKGAAAGLWMAAAKTLLKVHSGGAESTAGIVGRVNRELSTRNESCMFATLFLAILNVSTGEVIFTNAGHCRPYLIREGKEPKMLANRNGFPLGVDKSAEYTEEQIVLEPDDLLVIYSDGVTEAMNGAKELFGELRLEALLSSRKSWTAENAVLTITDAVVAFEKGTQPADDITVLAVKFHGK